MRAGELVGVDGQPIPQGEVSIRQCYISSYAMLQGLEVVKCLEKVHLKNK